MYKIDVSERYGRGIYAARDIQPNELIMQCELIRIPGLAPGVLAAFAFSYNETDDCVVLGDGMLFNHNDSPTVFYFMEEFQGRKVMVFRSAGYIKKDSQMFIDYRADLN